jgi:hypothetical protein
MGTVEKIVDTLNKMCMDKKSQATHRYEEHSAWLSSEFKNIRNLINIQKPVISESGDLSECRQKRKSPETCSNGSRNSPQAKRNSSNFADIAIAEGLPPDLMRMKKEDLLEALESRGNCTMTMKALKKDMVDALKDLLLDIHSRPGAQQEDEASVASSAQDDASITQPADSVPSSVATFELNPHRLSGGALGGAASPARKMSVLAEARQQVNVARQSVLQDSVESSADRSDRLAKEYEARKQRHRSSQIRLSQAMGTAVNDGQGSRSRLGSTDTVESGALESPNVDPEVDEGCDEAVDPADVEVEECSVAAAPADDNEQHDDTWNEVPSPHRDAAVEEGQTVATPSSAVSKLAAAYEAKSLFTSSSEMAVAAARKSPPLLSGRDHAKTLPLAGSPSMVDKTDGAIGGLIKTSVDDCDFPSSSLPAPTSAAPSSSSGLSHIKKLTNLIGGTQTSFLGGGSGNSSAASFTLTQSKTASKTVVSAGGISSSVSIQLDVAYNLYIHIRFPPCSRPPS